MSEHQLTKNLDTAHKSWDLLLTNMTVDNIDQFIDDHGAHLLLVLVNCLPTSVIARWGPSVYNRLAKIGYSLGVVEYLQLHFNHLIDEHDKISKKRAANADWLPYKQFTVIGTAVEYLWWKNTGSDTVTCMFHLHTAGDGTQPNGIYALQWYIFLPCRFIEFYAVTPDIAARKDLF